MSSDSHKSVEEQVKIYLNVFGALLVLTGVTVAVSYLDVSFI